MKISRILAGSVFLAILSTSALADFNYEYYEGDWSALPDFDALTPVATGTVSGFDISVRQRDSQFGFRFSGTIDVQTADTYTFYTVSDDGSQLFINGSLVVDNDGLHAPVEQSGQIALATGQHSIVVTFFEQGGGEVLDVTWSNSTNGRQSIPADGVIGATPDYSVEGQWGPVIPWPHVAVSAANLPDGRVLTWSGSERDTWPSTEQTYSGTWDPQTGEFVEIFHDSHNMFCAHLAMAEDGRVFVNGGRNQTNSPWTSLFDYRNDSWEQVENMPSGGRWYPTTLALADGDMFTAIGTATNQRNPDRWDPLTGWQTQNGIDFNAMVLDDYFSTGSHGESRWWPLLHVAPNGKIFHSGPTPQMHWINPTGAGSFEPAGSLATDFYHKHGTTVMYDEGKLLTAGGWTNGGSIASSDLAFTIDLNGPTPIVTSTDPMVYPRKFHNGVILPNGEVLVVGGNTSGQKFSDNGAVLAAEVWNPGTGNWRLLAPMSIPRNYHSIALLLTDGRVLAAGSGYSSNSVPASTHQDGQVFSPPYLFDSDGSLAQQPIISGGPGMVETGATFNVSTSEPIDYFSMIKMSSTTHGLNTDVRFLKPDFSLAGGNSYDVTLHTNPNVATPGYWMLFAVNAAGTPSSAHVIRITTVDTRLENRALSGVSSQSSTPDNNLAAANATDGDLSGSAASGSLSSTGNDINAWWEIDLGEVLDVDTIRLWNRTDCCAGQLADFHVLVSEDPFISQNLSTTINQPGVLDIFNAGAASRQTDLDIGARGQFVRVQLSGQDNLNLAEVQIFGAEAIDPPPQAPVENGVLDDVGSDWQTVTLSQSFADPVVIASIRYDATMLPAVTRVRNASGNQFDVRVQNPSDSPLNGYKVDYLVVEAGTYNDAGVKMEAVKFESTVTSENGRWLAEPVAYLQNYTDPVVIGQVMTANDARWSVFWASDGTAGNPPSATDIYIGKHIAEDTDGGRSTETIGYIVIESGIGSIGDVTYQAGLGADIVRGIVHAPPYTYPLDVPTEVAVVASAGMDGGNGSWPVIYGERGVSSQLDLGVDEDQVADAERNHTTEQVAFLAMEKSVTGVVIRDVSIFPRATGSEEIFVVDADGPGPLQFSWDFGDGSTPFSTDPSASHTFTAPGRHAVTVTVRDADGNEQQLTFTQLVYVPATTGIPSVSSGVIEYPSRGEVWSINPDNDSIAVIDLGGQIMLAEIPVPDEPSSLGLAPDGMVWVVSKGAASISVVDPATYSIAQMYFLDVGSQPHGLAMSPTVAFVALEATGEVVSLDVATGQELQRAYVGNRPRHLSYDANAGQVYAPLFVTPPIPGESTADPVVDDGTTIYGGKIMMLDPGTLNTIGEITLQHSDRLVSEHSGPGMPNYIGPAVVSPDGTSAWVPSKQDNILAGAFRGGMGMTFDQTVRAIVSKVELPAGTENFAMRGDLDNASVASHAAFDPFGIHLFVSLEGNREISVTDVHSGNEILRFDTGRAPQSVAVSQDGTRLFVHNFMDRSISVYDIEQLVFEGNVSVTHLGTIGTVGDESLAPDVLLGKQLFYDARDDRLAALNYMSCASCHNAGHDDGRVWDFTGIGEGLRNTISLLGRSGMQHGFLHWSANFDEVQDFEGQIRNFAGGTGLMSDNDFNAGTRSDPLGDAKAGISADLDALAAYVSSLTTTPASPFREIDGSLSAQAELGAALFETEGCSGCHTLPLLTDSSDETGLHDIGTMSASSGDRLGGPLTGIDTPTLLGAWSSAPYLHDGSQETLQSAISAHAGVTLTGAELDQLAALIRELDSGSELAPDSGIGLAGGVVAGVGSDWQSVPLANTYNDMVVVAAVQYDDQALPAVARIRNATGGSFELRVQNPSGAPLSGYTVHYVVADAGVYEVASHGIKMEAVKYTSTVTSRALGWSSEPRSYLQAYTNPVVLGQVMTSNDDRWSVFWASDGSRTNPPTAAALSVGKHVGEDTERERNDEVVGYLVFEAGSGSVDGLNFVAGTTPNSIRGILQGAPHTFDVGGSYAFGIVSSIAMNGGNGGWPVMYGPTPVSGTEIRLAIDEDQIADSERTHGSEEVSYFLLQ